MSEFERDLRQIKIQKEEDHRGARKEIKEKKQIDQDVFDREYERQKRQFESLIPPFGQEIEALILAMGREQWDFPTGVLFSVHAQSHDLRYALNFRAVWSTGFFRKNDNANAGVIERFLPKRNRVLVGGDGFELLFNGKYFYYSRGGQQRARSLELDSIKDLLKKEFSEGPIRTSRGSGYDMGKGG